MQKRESLLLDDTHYNFDDSANAAVYTEKSYGYNRGHSIDWVRKRCGDDDEIRTFIFDLRRQFRERITAEFPSEITILSLLGDSQDPNHFFVLIGQVAERDDSPNLRELARFFCEQLKAELNLDLHPAVFTSERPQKKGAEAP